MNPAWPAAEEVAAVAARAAADHDARPGTADRSGMADRPGMADGTRCAMRTVPVRRRRCRRANRGNSKTIDCGRSDGRQSVPHDVVNSFPGHLIHLGLMVTPGNTTPLGFIRQHDVGVPARDKNTSPAKQSVITRSAKCRLPSPPCPTTRARRRRTLSSRCGCAAPGPCRALWFFRSFAARAGNRPRRG